MNLNRSALSSCTLTGLDNIRKYVIKKTSSLKQ